MSRFEEPIKLLLGRIDVNVELTIGIKEHLEGFKAFLIEVLEVMLFPLVQFEEVGDVLHAVRAQELHEVLEGLIGIEENRILRGGDVKDLIVDGHILVLVLGEVPG